MVETALTGKNGWNGLGAHRMIGVDYSEGGKTEVSEAEKIFGNATVSVTSGYLNIREGASTRSKVIAKAENGARVNIIREAGGTGWVFGVLESGEAGYMSSEYLVEDAPGNGESGRDERRSAEHDDTVQERRRVYHAGGKMDDCGGLTDDSTKAAGRLTSSCHDTQHADARANILDAESG